MPISYERFQGDVDGSVEKFVMNNGFGTVKDSPNKKYQHVVARDSQKKVIGYGLSIKFEPTMDPLFRNGSFFELGLMLLDEEYRGKRKGFCDNILTRICENIKDVKQNENIKSNRVNGDFFHKNVYFKKLVKKILEDNDLVLIEGL